MGLRGLGCAPLTITSIGQNVRITASAPISVVAHSHGAAATSHGKSAPSLSNVVPTEQFRRSYAFYAPEKYEHLAGIVALTGSTVTLDGTALAQNLFNPLGSSGYSVAWVQLSTSGRHTASSSDPFGLLAFGYHSGQAYMFPARMELRDLTTP